MFGLGRFFIAPALSDVVVVWPLVFFLIRSRPATQPVALPPTATSQTEGVPGLELGAALRTATFWILAAVQLLLSARLTGTLFNLVPFSIAAGVTPAKAALTASLQAGAAFPRALIMRTWTDRHAG